MANGQSLGTDSVDKTRAEVTSYVLVEPTSIEDQFENGGWSNLSPEPTTTPYDLGGQAGSQESTEPMDDYNVAATSGK